MSDADESPRRKGRGFPPDQYKWRPGQSGNPAGRPRGARNKVRATENIDGLTLSELTAIAEGSRSITTADGSKLTTVAGIHRARNIGAMKGSRLHAKDALADMNRAEEKLQQQKMDALEKAVYIRDLAERMHAHHKAHGTEPTEFIVHPDDIEIDYATGSVRVLGPLFATEKRHLDESIKFMKYARRMIIKFRREVEKDPLSETSNYLLLKYISCYHDINECLPERHKQPRLPSWPKGRGLPVPLSWRTIGASAKT